MRWKQNKCPTCGEPASELAELTPAQAGLIYDPETDAYDWEGESRMCWDGQSPDERDGKQNLWCGKGHDWWTYPDDEITVQCCNTRITIALVLGVQSDAVACPNCRRVFAVVSMPGSHKKGVINK